jgi:DNA-binding response OmpR family regulator
MHAKPQILIIDDDSKLLEALTIFLEKYGYAVSAASDGSAGMQYFRQLQPDLVVLDIMMPGVDGWEVCTRIREISDTPVIMLTARGQEYDKIKSLKMGADDYLVKPFSLRELEARITAILRRVRRAAPDAPRTSGSAITYKDGHLAVDGAEWMVTLNGAPVSLTATERRLLFFLIENADHVMPTSMILAAVWGPEYAEESDYVKLYIWRLRHKLEADPEQPEYLLTERGVGYRFKSRRT